jgi:hypothetical protein
MSGSPSGAPSAAFMLSPEQRIEALLQQIISDRAQDAARMDAMQATIDTSIDLAALHRAAAAAGSPPPAVPGQAAGPSWLRRIVDTALQSPGGTNLAAAAPAAPAGAARPTALRAHFNLPNGPPPTAPARGARRIDAALSSLNRVPATGTSPAPATGANPAAATAAAAAAARARTVVDVDEDDDDYFDALDEQLELLRAAPDPEQSLADRFGGHFLPLPHLARFWPRDFNFQTKTCHYHPSLAGDRLNGGLVDNLTKLGEQQRAARQPEWGSTYAYELRTLVSSCSYLADTLEAQRIICAALNTALRAEGALPAGLESLPQDALDVAVQLQSTFSHLKERVDVLRAASRQSAVDVEILSRLYDSEERIAGERSALGAAVESRSLEGATRSMISASAKERVAAAHGASNLTPRGLPPRERPGGGREPRSARDRARRLQPAATGGRGAGTTRAATPAQAATPGPPRAQSPGAPPAPAKGAKGAGRGANSGGRGGGQQSSGAAAGN